MSEIGKISYTDEEIEGIRVETLESQLFEDAKTEVIKDLEKADPDADLDDDQEDRIAQDHLELNRERLTKEYLEGCKPGSFYCHEAIDRASTVQSLLDSSLLSHPSVLSNPEWFKLAHDAQTALFNLYQSIGDKHLSET